ncbi:MAG: sigma-54-dependent Fis family transcriptional regulator [Firmicutes bacterium]|nr:sigma-54-dependent Fis family transcriptional regulator [Bacillota bacterium]
MATILVIDDEKNMRWALSQALSADGHRVLTADDGRDGLEQYAEHQPDLVVLDVKMPGLNGMEVLKKLKELDKTLPVLMITAHGTIDNAIEAMKIGADDYITKPFELETVRATIARTLKLASLTREVGLLRQEMQAADIIGESPQFMAVMELVAKVAPSPATVLIEGESGTGKELVAKAIHRQSPRSEGPFIGVNCGALPENLLESELFGHEKGAFTGAVNRKPGRFERADGGTLFLDEVGELPPATQVRLLRVLQERELERVGGTETIPVNVRVVTATNRNLAEMVAAGEFREDLFYRLNVVPIHVPPLRERKADIPLLTEHFIGKYCAELGKPALKVTDEVLAVFSGYRWPGNIRELENVLERAVILAGGSELSTDLLPQELFARKAAVHADFELPEQGVNLEELEKSLLVQALQKTDGNKTRAANLLGISRHTLLYRLSKYDLKDD